MRIESHAVALHRMCWHVHRLDIDSTKTSRDRQSAGVQPSYLLQALSFKFLRRGLRQHQHLHLRSSSSPIILTTAHHPKVIASFVSHRASREPARSSGCCCATGASLSIPNSSATANILVRPYLSSINRSLHPYDHSSQISRTCDQRRILLLAALHSHLAITVNRIMNVEYTQPGHLSPIRPFPRS